MAMNMDAAIRIAAKITGQQQLTGLSQSLRGIGSSARLTDQQIGQLNRVVKGTAAAAGNSTAALRNHLSALQTLRERADIGGKAYARLGVEIDQLKGKLRSLDGQVEKTGAGLKEQLAGAAATAGIGQITRGIIAGAGEFDQAVRTAAAVASSGGGDFGMAYRQLRSEIEAVAAAAAGTPTEVANLAVALQRAGFTAQETAQSMRGIVAGAEATGITFEEMGSITADTLRQFGINTSETSRVVDVLTDASLSANQQVRDVGEAMKYAAPIARDLGVTFEDTAAMIALMAESGIRGSDAGTALRTGLVRLQIAAGGADSEVADLTRGNQQLTKAMAALGSQVLDTSGKLRPMDDAIIALKSSMEGLSPTDKAILLKALFGTEASSKFAALMNQSNERIREMVADIRDASGEAANTQKNMQGFSYAMKVLGGNIQIVTNAIGDAFIVVLRPLAGLLSEVITLTQSLPQPLRDAAAAAAAAGLAIGGIAIAAAAFKALGLATLIGGAVTALQGLTFAAAAAKVQMIALNAVALITNPWFALAGAIGAAAVALANYRSESDKVAAAAAKGDPAAVSKAKQSISQKEAQLRDLRERRAQAGGRGERASIDRKASQLQRELAAERAGVKQGEVVSGDPSGINRAKQSLSKKEAQLQALEQHRGQARGRERGSIDQQLANLRGKVAQERAAVQQGQKAAAARALPAVPVEPAAAAAAAAAAAKPAGGGGGGGGDAAAKKAATDAARAAEQMKSQQGAASQLLATERGRLLIAETANDSQRQIVEAMVRQDQIMRDYNEKLSQSKSAQETLNLQLAQQMALKTSALDLEKALNGETANITSALDSLLAQSKERHALEARYQQLLAEGINPELAREYAQLDLAAGKQSEMLTMRIAELEGAKAKLAAESETAKALQRQIDAMKEILRLQGNRVEESKKESAEEQERREKREADKAKAEEMKKLYGDIGMTIKEGVVGAIQGAIDGTKSLQEVASNLLQNIANKLLDVAINLALFGAMSGTGTGGGLLGFLYKENAKGNAYSANGIVPFAKGGLVTAPTLFPFAKGVGLMGEAGPEAIMPLKRLPSGRLGVEAAGGGGGGGVNVVVNVDAKGSRVEGDQQQGAALGRAISAAVQAELVKQQRPGGLLAGAR